MRKKTLKLIFSKPKMSFGTLCFITGINLWIGDGYGGFGMWIFGFGLTLEYGVWS